MGPYCVAMMIPKTQRSPVPPDGNKDEDYDCDDGEHQYDRDDRVDDIVDVVVDVVADNDDRANLLLLCYYSR